MATKKITCKHCGATMEVDEDKDILFCPYCGSKELIENNDNTIVTLAKLHAKEKRHKEDEQRRQVEEARAKWDAKPFSERALITIGRVLLLSAPFIFLAIMCIIHS